MSDHTECAAANERTRQTLFEGIKTREVKIQALEQDLARLRQERDQLKNPMHCDQCLGVNWIPCKPDDPGAIHSSSANISQYWRCGYCFYKQEAATLRQRVGAIEALIPREVRLLVAADGDDLEETIIKLVTCVAFAKGQAME